MREKLIGRARRLARASRTVEYAGVVWAFGHQGLTVPGDIWLQPYRDMRVKTLAAILEAYSVQCAQRAKGALSDRELCYRCRCELSDATLRVFRERKYCIECFRVAFKSWAKRTGNQRQGGRK